MKRGKKRSPDSADASPNEDHPHSFETFLAAIAGEPFEDDPEDEARGRAFARGLKIGTTVQLARLRRQLTPEQTVQRKAAEVSPELQVLPRAELLARLAGLRRLDEMRFNNMQVGEFSDNDLRQLIAELENVERSQS